MLGFDLKVWHVMPLVVPAFFWYRMWCLRLSQARYQITFLYLSPLIFAVIAFVVDRIVGVSTMWDELSMVLSGAWVVFLMWRGLVLAQSKSDSQAKWF